MLANWILSPAPPVATKILRQNVFYTFGTHDVTRACALVFAPVHYTKRAPSRFVFDAVIAAEGAHSSHDHMSIS
jgi:hypothetical protein